MPIKRIKEAFVKLIKLNNTPEGIALGVAIGVFIAILPLYGLHTLMVIVAAILLRRVNKIAILIGTNISLPHTVTFITWGGYELGRLVLGKKYPALSLGYFKDIFFNNFSLQRIGNLYHQIRGFYYPLFIGSVILGVTCAVFFYFIVLFFMKKIRKNKKDAFSG